MVDAPLDDRSRKESRDEEPRYVREAGDIAARCVVMYRAVVDWRRGRRSRKENIDRRPGAVLCAGAEGGVWPWRQTRNGVAGPGADSTTRAARGLPGLQLQLATARSSAGRRSQLANHRVARRQGQEQKSL